MLEPLPRGMHDRRVSSAESEAQQDWPPKPTEATMDGGVIRHCATEINSIQLHDSFVMVPLESIKLHPVYI